jgi:hypothetical protein
MLVEEKGAYMRERLDNPNPLPGLGQKTRHRKKHRSLKKEERV